MEGPPADRKDPRNESQSVLIRTFLIADIRGYTLFTQERGDEAAAKLTAKFAGVVKEVVEARGGSLIELRGDEALAVFSSTRQAIRTAVELQDRFVDETVADPSLPLTVGIGLDAGEAVPTPGGYRGGALNLAARLCGEAGPGECLASQEVVHLARKVEGIRYVDRGELHLKGLSQPVRVTAVRSEADDPARRLAIVAPARPSEETRPRQALLRRPAAIVVGAAVLVAAVVVPITLFNDTEFPGIDENTVGQIDLETGSLRSAVSLGARPGDIAGGEGSVWITIPDQDRITQIDPTGESVADTIPVGNVPSGIAVGEGSVWVAISADRSISRISPDTGTIVQNTPVGGSPLDVAVAYGSVWVTNGSDDTAVRIDPSTGEVVHVFDVGDRPDGVVAGAGAVWVANSGGGSVSRIDPSSNDVAATIPVGNGPADIHIGAGRVWVANRTDGTVSAIDPETNSVAATIPVGEGPSAVTTTQGSVWVASEFDGSISRIDPATHSVEETISVGNAPTSLLALRGALWVGVGPVVGSHRGGTLMVTRLVEELDSIDPAFGYTPHSWEIFSVTYDGLVGFRRTGGADGATLVPDLATSLPQPTDGGTTYTFQLRQGIRYSTGQPVRPEDFRWAIERGLRDRTGHATAANFFQGIVGAEDCTAQTCDLSRGIVTAGDSIVFHLEQPDPEFLYKLALPPSFAVPEGTPLKDVGSGPIPATGPYMISAGRPDERIDLVRNPYFEEWSAAAQPQGLVDRVELRYGLSLEEQVEEVLAGDADVALSFDPPPATQLAELQTRFAGQLHLDPQLATFYMVMNPNIPPFDDERVRRALNFAVDRREVAEIYGGTEQALPTCQFLPPNLPGYERYCPYTLRPGSEQIWTAPDETRARQLIRSSGTAGMKVTVWTSPDLPGGLLVGRYFEALLDQLGYRADVRTIRLALPYFKFIEDPANEVQIALSGWFADFPAASNFLVTNLSCGGFNNLLGFCDPQLDRLAGRASRLQLTDPPAAREWWARVDRGFVDQAAVVPLINPALADFVSERLGNYQRHPVWHVLLSRVWVR